MSRWRPIKTMPKDKLILLGTWVYHIGVKDPYPEFYLAIFDSESDTFFDQAYEASLPWDDIEDYDFWMKIDDLPKEVESK